MTARRMPVGAEPRRGEGVHFRVWAPAARRVLVDLEAGPGAPATVELSSEADGYHAVLVPGAAAGTRYRFRLDGEDLRLPDPASRFQPDGPHGPSEVVDPAAFVWTDGGWRGPDPSRLVVYELHVGTFTRDGTYAGAMAQFEQLRDLGVTMIELLPLADFAGEFGWGYDGVNMFAPTRLYGGPDDLRRLVDHAHALGIAVIIDVVYNHFGPDGNYIGRFSRDYFSLRHKTDWGEAINFDGENAGPVREFYGANAAYWIDEFHFDGLRLDATQNIYDDSPEHILAVVVKRARGAAGGRRLWMVAENEPNNTKLVRPLDEGGFGIDALWNDDFHHSAMVAMAGRREAYFTDYLGRPQEFISAAKHGYLYQGQCYTWQKQRRGRSSHGLSPGTFVNYLENHDQVANYGRAERIHTLTSPGRLRAMTGLLLLGPNTPMLFQGQEYGSSKPFFYFADHNAELAPLVHDGRTEFMRQFRSLWNDARLIVPDPSARSTFENSVLDLSERERNRPLYEMHRELLRLRRTEPALDPDQREGFDGAVLDDECLLLRYFHPDGDRLLIVNLGRDLPLIPAPEPLLAPPEGLHWGVLWSSEEPRFGGCGTAPLDTEDNWHIPGHAAVLLAPSEAPAGEWDSVLRGTESK